MRLDIRFDPIIAQLGPFELGWHGIFTALAVVVAVAIGVRGAERRGFSSEPVSSIATWGVVGGLIGARVFHVLDHPATYLANPLSAFAVWEGGIAVYGAFLGGLAGGIVAARRAGLSVWPLLDAAAPAMLVGQAIGRLGCFSNGDAWGAPTNADWGVVYWHPHDLLPSALLGVPTHPYPLYEIATEAVVLLGLWLARRWFTRPGELFFVASLAYAAIRFGLSFFRQENPVLGSLQEAQVVALLCAAATIGIWVWRRQVAGSHPPLQVQSTP